ncbi:MAG: biotin--[acetyl-CoA-carboxylase] ligase [Spirochaetaceae bacterium]|nr:biotin--[acetyl-CoA-carboxylase] ligase [Spirochaetaceae bacterium]
MAHFNCFNINNSKNIRNPWNAPVRFLRRCTSTMDEMRHWEREGAPHGSVIITDFQDAGRGRLPNRRWSGTAGKNLLFTVLFRYADISTIPNALTLRIGLAAALAVEDAVPALAGMVHIKWPNDLMLNGRKFSGILAESDGKNVFIGIGVNVLQHDFKHLPRATSIMREVKIDEAGLRLRLFETLLAHIAGGLTNDNLWRERINERLFMKGEYVQFLAGGAETPTVCTGILCGVSASGALLLGDNAGNSREFIAGEISIAACRI